VTKFDSACAVSATSTLRKAAGKCGRDNKASRISPSEPKRSIMRRKEKSAISAPPFTASAIRASRDPSSASAADTLIDSRCRSAIAGLW
jgi:hypothetical protein